MKMIQQQGDCTRLVCNPKDMNLTWGETERTERNREE